MCSGLRPDELEQLLHPLASSALGQHVGVDLVRFTDDVADRHARVQRGVRVLEDDLDVAPKLPHRRALLGVDVDAVEGELARGRLLQPHQHPAEGRLAAARLAHDAERLALVQVEGDAVQRLDVSHGAPQYAGLDRVVLDQVLGLQDDLTAHESAPPSPPPPASAAFRTVRPRAACPRRCEPVCAGPRKSSSARQRIDLVRHGRLAGHHLLGEVAGGESVMRHLPQAAAAGRVGRRPGRTCSAD